MTRLLPFLNWIALLTPAALRADIGAGLTGAVVVLPQGVAFALIAGLPPEFGLYTAIVVTLVAALFGSSRHLVSGPTTAISIVVFSVISNIIPPGSPHYLSYALTLTFLAGLFQLVLGLARMGSLVNFISHTVIIGFTTGAAVLIAISQLPAFFGITVTRNESFIHTLLDLGTSFHEANPYVVAVAGTTLAVTVLARHMRPRWPSMLIGMLAGSLLCIVIDGASHGVPLVGSLPGHMPPLSIPEFSIQTLRQLAPGALAVAMLGLIEAVSIARAIAARSQQRIDPNQEFIGQGLSNIVGSFFSCYAGSGSFTRSAINYDAGARTPLAAIVAALSVAVVLLFLAPATAYLPLPALAGVIMLVAWYLIDVRYIRRVMRVSKGELTVLGSTFLATLLVDLEFAIYAGVLLSLILYLQRTSHPRISSMAPNPSQPKGYFNEVRKHGLKECPQLKIIRLDGSLFFGAVNHVQRYLHRLSITNNEWKHILIVGSGINFIDLAGAEMLAQEARRMRARGGSLYLCTLKDSVHLFLQQSGYKAILGDENVFASKDEAIRRIFERLDHRRCELCPRRIFRECATVKFRGSVMGYFR